MSRKNWQGLTMNKGLIWLSKYISGIWITPLSTMTVMFLWKEFMISKGLATEKAREKAYSFISNISKNASTLMLS